MVLDPSRDDKTVTQKLESDLRAVKLKSQEQEFQIEQLREELN